MIADTSTPRPSTDPTDPDGPAPTWGDGYVASLPLDDFRDRVWASWGMVSGTTLGWGVPQRGYEGFEVEQLTPMLDLGYTRGLWHRPEGDDSAATGEPMNRDARVEAMDRKQRYVEGFGSMLARAARRVPGFLALPYLGSSWDPDFGALLAEGKYAECIDRHRRSELHIMNLPCCEPGYDHDSTQRQGYEDEKGGHVAGFPPGAWRFNWAWTQLMIQTKRLQGRRVWIEAMPHLDAVHQHACNFICTERVWDAAGNRFIEPFLRTRPSTDVVYQREGLSHTGSEWAAPTQLLTGQILCMDQFLGSRHTIADYADAIRRVLARGPNFHWSGALTYLRVPIATLHQAVVRLAAQRAGEGDA